METNGNPPSYPTPTTLVDANGHPLGNGGGFGPGSNKANPYAHAQPGMYAGGNTLTGVNPSILNMTIKDVLQKVPEIMQALAKNPPAFSALASFAEGNMINGRPGLELPTTKGVHGFQGFHDIIDDNEAYTWTEQTKMSYETENEVANFYAELLPDVNAGTIYRAMQAAATLANRSGSYTHTMPDGVQKTYENPHLTVERMKLGRHPPYTAILMELTSDNHPPVLRTFWVIDARLYAPDNATILITAEDDTMGWKGAHEFADAVYLSYHDGLRSFLDRLYFDAKYGWEENTNLSGGPQKASATPGVTYHSGGGHQ